jgi:hypothetical protein
MKSCKRVSSFITDATDAKQRPITARSRRRRLEAISV